MQVNQRVGLFWLGHNAFRITAPGIVMYLDPVGIDPRAASMLGEGEKADLILLTHEHEKHCDPQSISALKKKDAWIVGPKSAARRLVNIPLKTVSPSLSKEASAPEGTITMMFTDIVNSTAIKPYLGRFEGEWNDVWIDKYQTPHHEIMRNCLHEHHGFEVKTIGDSFFVSFADPVRAVRCAIDMQRHLDAAQITTPLPGNPPLQIRIGLHTGPVIRQGTDYVGTSVDKAARVEGKAGPEEITISEQTYVLIQGQMQEITLEAKGAFELKGLDGTHSIFSVHWAGQYHTPAQRELAPAAEIPAVAAIPVPAEPVPPAATSGGGGFGGGLKWSGGFGGAAAPSGAPASTTAPTPASTPLGAPASAATLGGGGLRARRVEPAAVSAAPVVAVRRPVVVPVAASGQQLDDMGESFTMKGATIRAIAAYNLTAGRDKVHPRAAGYVGYLVTVDNKVIYHLGDTDQIPEMNGIGWIDVALVPVSGGNVMDAREAAECVKLLRPQIAVPMHYGPDNDSAAQEFKRLVGDVVQVEILTRSKY